MFEYEFVMPEQVTVGTIHEALMLVMLLPVAAVS
jgi:hypothetical protein